MNKYKESQMWKQAMQLASDAYDIVAELSLRDDKVIGDQVRRAAVSVPANMAEGYGRDTARDYSRHLGIARGSLYELDTLLTFGSERSLFDYPATTKETVAGLVKMLHSAQNKLRTQYTREQTAGYDHDA